MTDRSTPHRRPRRPLPHRAGARPGRHGHGVPRRGPEAPPQGGGEGPAARTWRPPWEPTGSSAKSRWPPASIIRTSCRSMIPVRPTDSSSTSCRRRRRVAPRTPAEGDRTPDSRRGTPAARRGGRVGYAHQHGLVHRDIKPENVMLSGRHALVTDFGVAKAVSEATGRHHDDGRGGARYARVHGTGTGHRRPALIVHRADIYALGVLGYELLTGQPPFAAPRPRQSSPRRSPRRRCPWRSAAPASPACARRTDHALSREATGGPLPDRGGAAGRCSRAMASPSGGTTHSGPLPTGSDPASESTYGLCRRRGRHRGGVGLARVARLQDRADGHRDCQHPPGDARGRAGDPCGDLPGRRRSGVRMGYPGHTRIVVRDVSGGRPLPLTQDWGGAQVLPTWMPDGRSVVFRNLRTTADHAAGSWKLPRLGGQAVALDPAEAAALTRGFTVVSRGDTAYARDAAGSETLLRIGAGEVHSPAVRGDGSALAYVVGNQRSVYEWGNAARARSGSCRSAASPSWSPTAARST